jgi:hypothetical protein
MILGRSAPLGSTIGGFLRRVNLGPGQKVRYTNMQGNAYAEPKIEFRNGKSGDIPPFGYDEKKLGAGPSGLLTVVI